jgi:hypothetical protein
MYNIEELYKPAKAQIKEGVLPWLNQAKIKTNQTQVPNRLRPQAT